MLADASSFLLSCYNDASALFLLNFWLPITSCSQFSALNKRIRGVIRKKSQQGEYFAQVF